MKSYFRFVLLLIPSVFISCRTPHYMVESVSHTDSIIDMKVDTVWLERVKVVTDSMARHDSINVREYVREVVDTAGRIVRTDRTTERYELRESQRYTSLMEQYKELEREYRSLSQAYIDKRAEPYPVPCELTGWERLKMRIGELALALLAFCLAGGTVWYLCRIKK